MDVAAVALGDAAAIAIDGALKAVFHEVRLDSGAVE